MTEKLTSAMYNPILLNLKTNTSFSPTVKTMKLKHTHSSNA